MCYLSGLESLWNKDVWERKRIHIKDQLDSIMKVPKLQFVSIGKEAFCQRSIPENMFYVWENMGVPCNEMVRSEEQKNSFVVPIIILRTWD